MNINRKRQLLRRKRRNAVGIMEAAKALKGPGHTGARIEAATQGMTIASECKLITGAKSDPMDVLDITQIGADYPVDIQSFKDPKTDVVDAISGWDVNLSDPRK